MLEDTSAFLVQERQQQVIQLGEVISIGPKWKADIPWLAALPWPTEDKYRSGLLDDDTLDTEWKPMPRDVDYQRPAYKEGFFQGDLEVGDLVLFTNARILDHFHWEGDDILIYPGNWLHGVVTGTFLADNPAARRYDKEGFESKAPEHGDFMAKARPGKRWSHR
jgi:hypothetical protein